MDFCVSDSDFQIQETLSCPTQTYSVAKCGSDVRGMLEYNGQTVQIRSQVAAELDAGQAT